VEAEPTAHAQPSFDMRLVVLCMLAGGALHLGWQKLWFLTDDAFIAFRYVSNSMLGRGFVWNPAPFEPVEGYTSFLWVVLLRAVWSITGVEPPDSANPLALVFGYATLALGAAMVLRMKLPAHAERLRLLLLALVLVWTVSNRTFLTWLSSGLEASLFTCTVTYWLWAATNERASAVRYVAHLATASSLAALTRPDGLLFAAFAGVIAIVRLAFVPRGVAPARLALAALPALCIPAHLLFRYVTYGYWLPNTYYAKFVAPWPKSGWLYFASFAIEYGIWLWLLIAMAWLVRDARRLPRDRSTLVLALVCCALVAHFSYYTWVIGGDHFEYRVYAHLVLPLGIALAWMAARLAKHPALVCGIVLLAIASAQPVPWLHFHLNESGRDIRVARHFPRSVRPVLKRWDGWQRWLSQRAVCDRYHEHTRFLSKMQKRYPDRDKGEQLSWDERPIIARPCVGVVAWSMPNVAVIDVLGLNDRIVARTPVERKKRKRAMAHDRRPPEGYVDCFRPNVTARRGRARIEPRDEPLSDAEIRECEAIDRWLER
jgi:arabinofuranosyltransferase